jgi:outer membrane protein insertion porin family
VHKRTFLHIVRFIGVVLIFSSCVGTRFLEDGEKVLYKQQIKGNKNISTSKLESFYRQKPNARFAYLLPITPYVYLYEWGKTKYDAEAVRAERNTVLNELDNRIFREQAKGNKQKARRLQKKRRKKLTYYEDILENGNWQMRNGEPLVVYDTVLAKLSTEQMQLFLRSKGYFSSHVEKEVAFKRNRAFVTYLITENSPHIVDSLSIRTANEDIKALLQRYQSKSLLKVGDNYDQEAISKERERIELLLKDNGYYDFSRQYIEFNVYKKPESTRIILETVIKKPKNDELHRVYTIDSVNIITDANLNFGVGRARQRATYNNKVYNFYDYRYRQRILDQKILIQKGDTYSRANTFETQRQLGNLDIFKFINIRYDTTGGRMIANIQLSPLERFTASNEMGINVTQGFPGPFYNLSFKNRNTFKSLEILTLNVRAGIEGVPGFAEQGIISSQEFSTNLSVSFPRFIMPFGTVVTQKLAPLNPRTSYVAGYNFTNRPEFVRVNLNTSLAYIWQSKPNIRHTFTVLEVSQINSTITPQFDSLLTVFRDNGNQLFRAFNPSFVSSTHLNTVINFGRYGVDNNRKASFLRLYQEHGGLYVPLIVGQEWVDTTRLEYFQFLKLQADYRTYRPLADKLTLAWRLNVGIGRPYGEVNPNVLPYEKYFFAGGSSSLRAWLPRRLGPGSFTPELDENGQFNYQFEQPGEILFEGSVELRRPLVGFLHGALFADMGNTWTFSADNRPGGQFTEDFWREIALGLGFGLRLDFSFLIIRTDFGFKALDPAQPIGERWVLDRANFRFRDNYGPTFNLGIGYPF